MEPSYDIFITSTLHTEWNVLFNPNLCAELEKKGIRCYLPQRDTIQDESPGQKFRENRQGIQRSGKILAVCVNETPNLGAEVGFAFGLGKEIIGLMEKGHEIPLMIKGMIPTVFSVSDLEDIGSYSEELGRLLSQ